MIEYMLLNLGFVAASLGITPEDITGQAPVPDDSIPPKPIPHPDRPYGRGLEGITIAESFYSPIRRTDFL